MLLQKGQQITLLYVQLLAERVAGTSLVFNAYIANLPIGVAGLPMFFPAQSIRALQYPPLIEQASSMTWAVYSCCRKACELSSLLVSPACRRMSRLAEGACACAQRILLMQVRKRCSWLLDFSSQQLARLPGTADDPFSGERVDANALGLPCRHASLSGPRWPGDTCRAVTCCHLLCWLAQGCTSWRVQGCTRRLASLLCTTQCP